MEMPPRAVGKGNMRKAPVRGPGPRRARKSPNLQLQQPERKDETSVEQRSNVDHPTVVPRVVEVPNLELEAKPETKESVEVEAKPELKESTQVIKEEEAKEAFKEDYKAEQVDVDEDDSDYDPEEEVDVDYNETGIEGKLPINEEKGKEEDEEGEEGDLDEKEIEEEPSINEETGEEGEEGDMEEEEMEGFGEEFESDGDEEHVEEEHEESVEREYEELGDREHEELVEREHEELGECDDEELADREHEELADREHEELGESDDEELADREHEELADREREEHHEVVKERRKRKEFEVFVGRLDKDASKDDLKKVFSAVGEIVEIRLMMNPQTKKNKGFAFLRFATVEQAKRAVKEMKNPMVNGKQCVVEPCQDIDTLFLGNICKTWTKEALKEKLKQYGINDVEGLTLIEDSNNAGMNRGFAFLEFPSRSDAMGAYKRLQKRDVVFGVDKNAKVAYAESLNKPDDEIMAQVKTVFLGGLPVYWDEDRVKEQLKKFGEIKDVELARNIPSARRKDYGFVTFDTHDNAVVCAESINNAELGDGDNKVKVRARLSRPLQKGRGKVTSRGRGAPRGGRTSRIKPSAPSFPTRSLRGGGRFTSARTRGKGSIGLRDKRPSMEVTERVRPLPPPSRSYSKKPVPSLPRSSSKRDLVRRGKLPPSRVVVDYSSRAAPERRSSYNVDYAPRGSSYSDDGHRGSARVAPRRPAYVDETYERGFERPPPSYREGRTHDYEIISVSKRPYSALEDVPLYHAEAGVRQSRIRVQYGDGGSSSQYADTYSERVRRSHLGYARSKTSLSTQEAHGAYGSRHGMSYTGGSYGDRDVGGAYPSSYASDYMSRKPDVVGRTYSSLYSDRSLGGNNYPGGGGSGSYY